ncbi:MAG: RNA polymerase subunit sigma, partial [Candidatus Electrothrix sp. AR4]|nr:RNA polymerase subunit sigma [Candidatus Electrothrix sp. AR4]
MLASIKEDLLKAGKGEGCITFKHLNKLLPEEVKDPGAIEAVFDFLNAHNIEIVTVEDSGKKKTLSGEEWTGKEEFSDDEHSGVAVAEEHESEETTKTQT